MSVNEHEATSNGEQLACVRKNDEVCRYDNRAQEAMQKVNVVVLHPAAKGARFLLGQHESPGGIAR